MSDKKRLWFEVGHQPMIEIDSPNDFESKESIVHKIARKTIGYDIIPNLFINEKQ